MNPSNLKHRFSKNGTIAVSCKGSHHLAWYKERKEEDIQDCLKHFCRDCPILNCERSGKSENRGLEAFLVTETESAIEFRKKGWKPSECFEEKEKPCKS